MMPIPDNKDLFCYYVTKHSTWKGKYKRIFSIGTCGITTYNPNTLEITNRWPYGDVLSLQIVPNSQIEFIITIKKERSKNGENMRFSTEYRSHLLTDAFKQRDAVEKSSDSLRFDAFKYHWSETRLPVLLEVTPVSIDQLDTATNQVLASYCYKDIQSLIYVEDFPGGFVISSSNFGRLHLFITNKRDEIRQKIQEKAVRFLSIKIEVKKEQIRMEDFLNNKFGKFSGDEHITSMSEFKVQKNNNRHVDSPNRLLCLSQSCLVERDPQTYSIVTLRPLVSVIALIRCQKNAQLFIIEYADGSSRTYIATHRDSFLATLLDAVRVSGNRDVHVKMCPTNRGKRMGPFFTWLEEEVETGHLKYLNQPSFKANPSPKFSDLVERFNTNVPYSGLQFSVSQDGIFSDNKEKMIQQALQALVQKEIDVIEMDAEELEALFQALRRLVASRAGFGAFTALQGFRECVGKMVVKALKREDEAITHAAINMVCALMQPMSGDNDIRQEQLNKSSLLSSHSFLQSLLDMWIHHVSCGTAALVVLAMLDFLTFALCIPYSETTEAKHFDALLNMVAEKGRVVFKHFQHSSLTIVKGAGLVMRALIEEGDEQVATRMQELALCEGALPRHLQTALFTKITDQQMLAHRQLSRHLVGLWVTGNASAMALLQRIMPTGLLSFLDSEDKVPENANENGLETRDNLKLAIDHAARNQRNPHLIVIEKKLRAFEKNVEQFCMQHWGTNLGIERKDERPRDRPIVLRKRRERVRIIANWPLFFYKFNQNHALSNLIWNHKTRDELREALENEVRAFSSDRELSGNALIAWNHHEFEMQYQCLADEVCIDGYYLRLLLEKDDAPESLVKNSQNFFYQLYHKFLLATKVEMKCMCLKAMAIVYGRYYEDIGFFSDTKNIVAMLERCGNKTERDHMIILIEKLILNNQNVKALIDAKAVQTLIDLITLAHLHTNRAVVPTQTNVIEAGENMSRDNEKEWYYNISSNESNERVGPLTFQQVKDLFAKGTLTPRTKCWAIGMENWRAAQNIPQLKWSLLAQGAPIMNESEMACLILNIVIKMCQYYPSRNNDGAVIWPIPRIKRDLSNSQCLPHIVQLLLTFDPILVEKVATLLCHIAEDNTHANQLYKTGVFYFILMYNGSNVLPIAKFLKLTHTKQAFRGDEAQTSELMQTSVLGQLLPEAMVNYLENHGPAMFAQTFLGEFDTPEAIWSAEMRRLLIEKIALHISDFTPKLRGNNKTLYHYLSIPVVRYPQLQNELFCNIFYLRHLCDTSKFPDWPIKEPVKLLRDVLEAWKAEVEKKPPIMSVDDAYEALNLSRGQHHDENQIRKSYYRLAQKYHPDKNPQGREYFEKVNAAYEFLCSRSSWTANGPNPNNIVLILRTQSILFHRYSLDLHPYKYAGYKQLIKTIQLETADDQLFSKPANLLVSATELAYYTVSCSALNAEELNRENGFQVLLEAYSRCVSVLNKSSLFDDVGVQVCMHCTRCFTVAAQFPACRNSFVELPQLIDDLIRILYFKNLPKLCCAAVESISSLVLDSRLQHALLHAGILWYLLSFLFFYDFTLEECGVERTEEANIQAVMNRLAKLSVNACAKLGGYLQGTNSDSPHNPVVRQILEKLLTPFLAEQFAEDQPEKLLKYLTNNTENPYLLWDNSTRAELLDFLENKFTSRNQAQQLDNVELTFSCHSKELIIGNIFIRVYNSQPTFPIQNAKGFILDLLDYVKKQQPQSNEDIPSDPNNLSCLIMALHALSNVINANPGLEMQCIGHFHILFPLLSLERCQPIQSSILNVIVSVTRNQECINDIGASNVLIHVLLVLHSLIEQQLVTLNVLHALITSPIIVKDMLSKGGYIYLLDLLFNSNVLEVKIKAAELLGRLYSDKLSGPRVRLALDKFLPSAITDALRESPSGSVQLLETNQENPELVWDEDSRKQVSVVVKNLTRRHYLAQKVNSNVDLKLPEKNVLGAQSKEIIVGGVYLRLFNNNPGWILRKPREFLSELLETCIKVNTKDPPNYELLEVVVSALLNLLQAHPNLADQVPAMGHIPRLCAQMSPRSSPHIPRTVIRILHQLATSEVCISTLSQINFLKPMKTAMQENSDIVNIGCDTMGRLFLCHKDQLVKQALDADLIPYLLSLLDGRLQGSEHAARSKALVVKALKSMCQNQAHGVAVSSLLEQSPVWASYSEQKHDLFITNTPTQGYLQGVPATAGYLTQGSSQPLPTSPPPIDKDDS